MKLADGREAIATFELPLSMTLVGALSGALDQKLTELGYTDVVVDTTNGWKIIATPPKSGRKGS